MNRLIKMPGRPRSQTADRAILKAAMRQLQEQGYARMSMESIAAEAGVSKATIYRRYQGKEDLASAAVAHLTEIPDPPDTGDTRTDLVQLLKIFHKRFGSGKGMSVIGTLLMEERHNPELIHLFRKRVIQPRRAHLKAILQRGVSQREIRADLNLDHAADCLIGAWFARYLAGSPASRSWADEIVDLVWVGIS